jgi:hypothetical protein
MNERLSRVAELTAKGRSAADIGRILGVSARTVVRWRVAAGVARQPAPPITDAEIAEAQRLRASGQNLADTARLVGRSVDGLKTRLGLA